MVKPEGGEAMYFWLNQCGVQWKLGGWEAPEGVKPPDKSSTAYKPSHRTES